MGNMKMRQIANIMQVVVAASLALVLVGNSMVDAAPVAGIRERATGSQWGWLFNDPPWEPHYGTSFRGTSGSDPNFNGSGGNAATQPYSGGIKAWNWWGTGLGTLLTPKSWVCWPLFNCPDRTVPGNYDAMITR